MINTPINDREFVRLQVQGASEFGESWFMMNCYLVSLAKSHKINHVQFSMGLVRMSLEALRTRKIDFSASDFLTMVLAETTEGALHHVVLLHQEEPELVGADA